MSAEQIVLLISTQFRGSDGTEASMTCASLDSVADKQVLYLTTVGRRTGLPREIEIWFVVWRERLYLFAETREAAGWVKNIRRTPKVEFSGCNAWRLAGGIRRTYELHF